MSNLIRKLLDLGCELWLQQNYKLHHSTSRQDLLQCQADIRAHYARPRHLYPAHVHHRFTDLNALLQQPLATQQAWLETFETHRHHDHRLLDPQSRRCRFSDLDAKEIEDLPFRVSKTSDDRIAVGERRVRSDVWC